MRLLNLDLLQGPGESLDENFELLCLELAKRRFPNHECYQVKSPDGGIDIYARCKTDPKRSIAIQCKAYKKFTSSLAREAAESYAKAAQTKESFHWESYIFCLPLVMTLEQH